MKPTHEKKGNKMSHSFNSLNATKNADIGEWGRLTYTMACDELSTAGGIRSAIT